MTMMADIYAQNAVRYVALSPRRAGSRKLLAAHTAARAAAAHAHAANAAGSALDAAKHTLAAARCAAATAQLAKADYTDRLTSVEDTYIAAQHVKDILDNDKIRRVSREYGL